MDKFGIFNLISSLLGGNFLNSDKKPQDVSPDQSLFSGTPDLTAKDSATFSAENRAKFPPLQNSMLATMKNHDEFIKRVKNKNPERQREYPKQ
ncbi:MAG: hypothetical protein J5911_06475 [Clostridia bacterium]|nr:hypothetical protein [Clostridia bacterium]